MRKCRFILLLFSLLVAGSGFAVADDGPPTNNWTLEFETTGNNVAINLSIDNPEDLWAYDGLVQKNWRNIQLGNGAMLEELILGLDGDPQVVLNFTVIAGTTDTVFTINSAGLPFPLINPAEGTASAAVTVTDNDGNGATGTGLLPGGKFYQTTYNSGTSFWYGIDGPVIAWPYGSSTGSEGIPPWQGMGGVNQMASQFSFSLSAGDGASGTSSYVIRPVPEPSSLATLAFGAVGLAGTFIRRRR